jgi:membrane fusion protein (multidrug efflux system)
VATAQAGVAQAVARRNQAQAALLQAEVAVQNARDAVGAAQARANQSAADVRQSQEKVAALQTDIAGQQAKVKQAQAAVQQASGGASALLAGVNQQRAKVAQARTGVQQARGNVAALRADVAGQRAKIAQAQAALLGTAAAPEQVSSSRAQALSALGKVRQARARVHELQLQLSYTKIVAPHDGVVSRKSVTLGQMVQPGQSLLTLADLNSADVIANFKETQLNGMRVGSPAEFTVDAYPGHVFHGHIASFSPGTGAVFSLLPPENATGNFTKVVQRVPVKIAIDDGIDEEHPLRLGMSVEVTVETNKAAGRKRRTARR